MIWVDIHHYSGPRREPGGARNCKVEIVNLSLY
jgi:hypothetical protein